MKFKICLAFIFLSVFISIKIVAQSKDVYTFEKSIALPGNSGFDYLYSDVADRKLYVSHGNAVHVLDLTTEKLIATIDSLQGVHGIAIVHKIEKGFITDGINGAVVVFDLKTLKVIKTIKLSGKNADAIMYDEYSNQLFVFNNGGEDASVIDVDKLVEKKLIRLGGAPEFRYRMAKEKYIIT